MINDEELENLLREAAEAIPVPARGPDAIMASARTSIESAHAARWSSFRPREFALAGTSFAAVVALVVVLLTSGGTSTVPPPIPLAASRPPVAHASSGAAFAAITPSKSAVPTSKSASAPVARNGRDIVATGTLHLGVASLKLASSVARLEGLAPSLGGYVGHATVAETGKHLGGSIVLEVPAASFSKLVTEARRTGTVRSLSTSDQDVSTQVVDLGARLTALVDERAQLEALLTKTAKVSDLLAVESQIEAVQSEIEQIQGERRVLDQQVNFSALTVDLAVPTPHHSVGSQNGFGHAWHAALTGFVNGVKALVAHLGDIVFGVLAALVGLLVLYLIWRRGWPLVRRRLV